MASLPLHAGRASALPLNLIAQAVPMLSRNDLEALTERLIDRLDEIDGDSDLEDDDPAEDEHDAENEDGGGVCSYDLDQRVVRHWGGTWMTDG